MKPGVFDRLWRDRRLAQLCEKLRLRAAAGGGDGLAGVDTPAAAVEADGRPGPPTVSPVVAAGLWGSSAPILAAMAARRLGRPLLLVGAHTDEADDSRDDIETALGTVPELLPQLDAPGSLLDADDELAAQRLRLCLSLSGAGYGGLTREGSASAEGSAGGPRRDAAAHPPLIVAPIQALLQPVPAPQAVLQRSMRIETGQSLDPDRLATWLVEHGFARRDAVEIPGDFARRGGIVDVFCHTSTRPARVEFFGDRVESIRLFDAATQRSLELIEAVCVPPCGPRDGSGSRSTEGQGPAGPWGDQTTSFLTLLPPDTIVAFLEPLEIQEIGRAWHRRLADPQGHESVEAVFRRAGALTTLYLQRFSSGQSDEVLFDVHGLPPFPARPLEAAQTLGELAREQDVVVLCDNAAEQQRLAELLREAGLAPQTGPGGITTAVGLIHRGFVWGALRAGGGRSTAFVPHHELLHRYRQRRKLRRVAPARPIDTFFDLQPGDYVVHTVHGIGRFRGLRTMERDGGREEYLTIEFADQAVVHVPSSQIHVVSKYVGARHGRPALSKLGGTAWRNAKRRVAEAVTDLAAELLAIQAERAAREGIAYPADTAWQKEFEESFPYEETEDQLRAMEEIKADMMRPRPMDRLLCGDVGFGKTELAIRAAFKVVESGRQVAVLVPTTVLAEQHHQTFRERMADYPFVIEVLSRFRSRAEQTRIVEQARKGQVDILIGTHRLLSPDVRFADLGLVIIDEEQRFGVQAKEQLKRLRATVDVLTLSATPIPRTLHMALLGIRDISSLATPPLDRRAILTQVRVWDDRLIREAILRELGRGGQVYFVHNLVRDIRQVAARVAALVPEARVVVGHGQMRSVELEAVMLKFLRRQADVLVCTNIVESGLDIPTANTIFIHRADRFGLADLHQLRGRVGRSHHRAYAYLLLDPNRPVLEKAARRLKAIEQFSELGAGFQIALRDLEIRGAGNLLGPEQSGHIEAVGYDMYCQLLEQAVRRLRNEPAEPWRPVNLDLGIAASIPRTYIASERQRMEVYKRLASARTLEDVQSLAGDLRDAFGPAPPEVETLLTLAEIRTLAQPWGIRSIVLAEPDVIFSIDDLQRVQTLFSDGPGSPRMPDPRTIHWRLPKRLLEPARLLRVLKEHLARAPAQRPAAAAV